MNSERPEELPVHIDELIVVSREMDWFDAVREVTMRAEKLAEKLDLKTPIETRLLDGHGNEILAIDFNWDEEGNEPQSKLAAVSIPGRIADGMFFVMEDSQGKRVVVKLQVEGQKTN